MPDLKVPSLQHLARNWRDSPAQIQRELVNVVLNPPIISYAPLAQVTRDLLLLRVAEAEVIEGIRRGVKPPDLREDFIVIAKLISRHFAGVQPTFIQSVARRLYGVGRGLFVPFTPPIFFSVGGQLVLPWLSYWRSNPLCNERLSLFVTIVREIMDQDPDLETARLEIIDLSLDKRLGRRELKVIDGETIPRVDLKRKTDMLDIFAEGYYMARTVLAQETDRRRRDHGHGRKDGEDPDQPSLF